MGLKRKICHISVLVCCLGVAAVATAQEDERALVIDLFAGQFNGSVSDLGMAGAFSPMSSGLKGAPHNPAGYAAREPWHQDWFLYRFTFSLSFAADSFGDLAGSLGFFRNAGALFASSGLGFQVGPLGLGFVGRLSSDTVRSNGEALDAFLGTINWGAAYGLFDNQLVLGVGGRTAFFNLSQTNGRRLLSLNGTGLEVGAMLMPADLPWRAGVAGRTAVRATPVVGEVSDHLAREGYTVPTAVALPWEVELGGAIQFGYRPLNRRWIDMRTVEARVRDDLRQAQLRRQRQQWLCECALGWFDADEALTAHPAPDDPRWWVYEAVERGSEEIAFQEGLRRLEQHEEDYVNRFSREYVKLAVGLLFTGPTSDGVSLESYVAGRDESSGNDISVTPRVGVEFEPWPNRMITRLGTYLEPPRFEGERTEVHATAGMDLYLFTWDVFGLMSPRMWTVRSAVDWAPDYFDWGLSFGVWH